MTTMTQASGSADSDLTNNVSTVTSACRPDATAGANIAATPVAPPLTVTDDVTPAIGKRHTLCGCGCGVTVTDPNNRGRKYASSACKARAHVRRRGPIRRDCIVCGESFQTSNNARVCSAECRELWREYRTAIGRTVREA
ncbi:MAG: hypothetical protein M9928_15520 [Anaerolineae bacterium]|nr:hypothetical protein [Anaerolineae bacterium]MCO5194578.1 hypothetical protein [Anaerolineae bacterium]MCO5199203.1 hypothetical protein [Anaerolineae bacterium]MCO5206445.1 hypothetical protein [Anaerolineae bacterium]